MNIAEFHRAAREIAAGSFFTTQIDVTEHSAATGGAIEITWRAYLAERACNGWTEHHKTPESCLAELRAMPRMGIPAHPPVDETPLEALGEPTL